MRHTDVLPIVRAYPGCCVAIAVALGLASGCSAATATFVSGPGDGGPADVGDGGGDLDPSHVATDGGPKDAEADVEVPPTAPSKVGRILVGETITIVGTQHYNSSFATAMFYENPSSTSTASCTYAHLGACHVYDCPLGGPVADAGAPRYAGAGTVSITGGLTNYTLTVAAGSYTSVSSQQLLFEAGTVLHVASTGAEVPAFSNKTLTVPSATFSVQSPALGSPPSIARSQALAISWSGANGRDVQVSVSTIQDKVRSVSISCAFPGSPATAAIPAAAMNKLLATSATTKGYLSVGAPVENTFSAGEWVVTFGLNVAPASSTFTTTN